MNDAIPVKPKDSVCVQCSRCGSCCRNLENQLMLEPLDVYNLARCLRDRGEAASIDDVYYAIPTLMCWRGFCPSI